MKLSSFGYKGIYEMYKADILHFGTKSMMYRFIDGKIRFPHKNKVVEKNINRLLVELKTSYDLRIPTLNFNNVLNAEKITTDGVLILLGGYFYNITYYKGEFLNVYDTFNSQDISDVLSRITRVVDAFKLPFVTLDLNREGRSTEYYERQIDSREIRMIETRKLDIREINNLISAVIGLVVERCKTDTDKIEEVRDKLCGIDTGLTKQKK